MEVLISTPVTRSTLQGAERLEELNPLMTKGRDAYGMQTFDQSLDELLKEEAITAETSRAARGTPEVQPKKIRRSTA